MMEVVTFALLYNYWTPNSFTGSNMSLGRSPSIAAALIEFTKEVNYGVVNEKADIPIFQHLKQLVMHSAVISDTVWEEIVLHVSSSI